MPAMLLLLKPPFPRTAIQAATLLWGISCFLPVGISYLAATVLILLLLVSAVTKRGDLRQRWQKVREHLSFWPVVFFLAWTLAIFCFLPHYEETPSNLFHSLRIALTVLVVLALREAELRAGLIGWVIGAMFALCIIYFNRLYPLPHVIGLRDALQLYGNKSIGIAVSLAIFASCASVYSFCSPFRLRRCAILVLPLVVPALILWLPSRTSLVLIILTLSAGLFHLFWLNPFRLLMCILVLALAGYGLSQTPSVKQRFGQGIVELRDIKTPEKLSEDMLKSSSWGMRYLLYKHTSDMLAERPWTGWGIGSWNHQWRQRTPPHIHPANMPHNDFLWMGAQSGLPGALALVAVMLSLLLNMLRLRSFVATCSIMATVGLLVAMSLNSALRDAQIGMSVLFVVVAINALAFSGRSSASVQPKQSDDAPEVPSQMLGCGQHQAKGQA